MVRPKKHISGNTEGDGRGEKRRGPSVGGNSPEQTYFKQGKKDI